MKIIQAETIQVLICIEKSVVIWFKSMKDKNFMESHREPFYFLSVKSRIVYSKMFFRVEGMERLWQGWCGADFNIFLHQFTYGTTIF